MGNELVFLVLSTFWLFDLIVWLTINWDLLLFVDLLSIVTKTLIQWEIRITIKGVEGIKSWFFISHNLTTINLIVLTVNQLIIFNFFFFSLSSLIVTIKSLAKQDEYESSIRVLTTRLQEVSFSSCCSQLNRLIVNNLNGNLLIVQSCFRL